MTDHSSPPPADTGKPDMLVAAHEKEKEFERSERIAASGAIVPSDDATEWIEVEKDDWLDADSQARSRTP